VAFLRYGWATRGGGVETTAMAAASARESSPRPGQDQETLALQGLLLNDDYTPMEFVVHVLERFFSKPREEAVQIMLHVHRHGVGICGVYTFEVGRQSGAGDRNWRAGTNIRYNVRWKRSSGTSMPSLSRSLEQALHRAIRLASERHHEYATLEHLLLALVDDADAAQSHAGLQRRSGRLARRPHQICRRGSRDADDRGWRGRQAHYGFQRVVQRAVLHVQNSGRDEVTGANVLVALFSERESHAVYFLQEQNMSRLDAVNYMSHGIAKRPA